MAAFPSGAEFTLELALDEPSRSRGYMYRERIGVDEGMLFVFDKRGLYPFWMKNCKASLDIIWLDDQFRVVEIAHDQHPCPPEGACPTYIPMRMALYVLEVAAGTVKREGLQRGDRVVVDPGPPFP